MNTKMSSPWVSFVHEMEAFFGKDPDIKLDYNEHSNTLKIYVDNQQKAEALKQLLPEEKAFGNVTLNIVVIPANLLGESPVSLFQKALEGNPIFSGIETVGGLYSSTFNYIMFAKEVVQYWNDMMNDPHGRVTTLYQDIAKDIFGEHKGIYYCTE